MAEENSRKRKTVGRKATRPETSDATMMGAGPMGATFKYSNCGYIVVAAMLEARLSQSWESLMHTHVFKPLDTIRASYVAQNITPEKDIIAYCNGGLESSHLYFVLHDLLKYPHVRVYDGSWTEYSVHEELPAATGPNP